MHKQKDIVDRHSRPVILMTPDLYEPPHAATEREYVVRTNYAKAIVDAGGIPLILPYESSAMPDALSIADGILITGAEPGVEVSTFRSAFEKNLIRETLEASKPLLGICHGMQLIGEYLGGTFVAEMPDVDNNTTFHMPKEIPDSLAHAIIIMPNSLLADRIGDLPPRVNSLHRHFLTGSGNFEVIARAPDGIIEAFEGKTSSFCLGIQWHPEYQLTELDEQILKTFVDRCAGTSSDTKVAIAPKLSVYDRLDALGLTLPPAPVPPGAFVGAIRHGQTITVSGQVPLRDGTVLMTGQIGENLSIEQGQECARYALLNALAQLDKIAGGLDKVAGFVRVAGYVASGRDYTKHGSVIDGASDLLRALFPGCWQHARIAVGVASLPRGVPVEIELTATLKSNEA